MKNKKQRLRSEADKLAFQKYLQPTCQICGEEAKQLHHFYPKSIYNHLRYTPENLISLCLRCHFLLTHQNRRLEDKIREKRGEKWFRKLSKLAHQRPDPSFKTTDYYNKKIKELKK